MNSIFICVIVLVKMCFHMLNLCWFKHKKILSVLGVFGKYFVFTKIENFQKQCCPVLATQSQVRQVFCHSRELMSQFWRLVRKWKVRSRRVHREFHGSARNSLAGRPFSHKKHLEIFFIIWLWVFWRLALATCWWLTPVSFSKPFQFSLEHFMTIHFLSQLELTQTLRVTLYNLYFCTFHL